MIKWRALNERIKREIGVQLSGIEDVHSAQIAIYHYFERFWDDYRDFLIDINLPVAMRFQDLLRRTKAAEFDTDLRRSVRLQAEESARWMVRGHQELYQELAGKNETFKFDNIVKRLDEEAMNESVVTTNISSSSNMGALSGAYDEYEMKQWEAILDDRTRPTHSEANGQIVPIDSLFAVGMELMMHPGDMTADPAEWANCRCSMIFLRADEVSTGWYRPSGD